MGEAMAGEATGPLYVRVAHLLQQQIMAGVYPVGSLLPTELELAELHGVSRQTVRQAVQVLRQKKLVLARKGIGTRVEARLPEQGYYFTLQSLRELFQYASETVFHVENEAMVEASGAIAARLATRGGKQWLHLTGLRTAPDTGAPICWTEVFVEERFAMLFRGVKTHRSAMFSAIERHSGDAVIEVEQEISATVLNETLARQLRVAPGAAALSITRRYFGTGRRLFEVSVNLHPAEHYSYTMTLKQEGGTQG